MPTGPDKLSLTASQVREMSQSVSKNAEMERMLREAVLSPNLLINPPSTVQYTPPDHVQDTLRYMEGMVPSKKVSHPDGVRASSRVREPKRARVAPATDWVPLRVLVSAALDKQGFGCDGVIRVVVDAVKAERLDRDMCEGDLFVCSVAIAAIGIAVQVTSTADMRHYDVQCVKVGDSMLGKQLFKEVSHDDLTT